MATTPLLPTPVRPPRPAPDVIVPPDPPRTGPVAPRRLASNFAALSAAEFLCRATSVLVTLYLAKCLGKAGYGRIEFAFNVVYWLVLLVRDGLEVIAAREIARHPRVIRSLVNHVLAVKGLLALGLYAGLIAVATFTLSGAAERTILALYGLLLVTTAMGLDFVYRGRERMGLVAVSLVLRTAVYAVGVGLFVADPRAIVWVPAWLVLGEACGIALVWVCYARQYGLPRPALGGRFARVVLRRGRPVYLIQVSQTIISSVDLLIVGLMCDWAEVGLFSAPHRMVTAVLTFGLIFQQVAFPMLARSWRECPKASRAALDGLVRVLVLVLLPLAVGTTVLARPLVRLLFPAEYADAGILLALGVWRAPLLTLAYLYQTALIALNREAIGGRLLLMGAILSPPLVVVLCAGFGLPGASAAVLLIGLALVAAGYQCLGWEGRQPAWHHHLAYPGAAALVMVPVCLVVERWDVRAAIGAGAVVYFAALTLMGGLRREDLKILLGRCPAGTSRAVERA